MQSDGDDFSTKVHQLTVLIKNADLDVVYGSHCNREVDHLGWNFDDLETGWYCRKKLVDRVHLFSVEVCSRGYVALDSQSVHLDNAHWIVGKMQLVRRENLWTESQ